MGWEWLDPVTQLGASHSESAARCSQLPLLTVALAAQLSLLNIGMSIVSDVRSTRESWGRIRNWLTRGAGLMMVSPQTWVGCSANFVELLRRSG